MTVAATAVARTQRHAQESEFVLQKRCSAVLLKFGNQKMDQAMSPQNEQAAPIPALTGMRFVAALMVFVSHYPIPGVGGAFKRMADSGYIGVTFFFILSGFVLAYNHLDAFEGDVRGSVIGYLVSRVARIYPLYLFCILLAWVSSGAGAALPIYLLGLQAWSPDVYVAYGLDGPAWSISVEMFLYACFPILIVGLHMLRVLRDSRRLFIAAAVVVTAMIGLATFFALSGRGALPSTDPMSAARWIYRTPLTRLLDFMLGIFVAVYYLRFSAPLSRKTTKWIDRLVYFSIAAILGTTAIKPMFASAFSFDVAYAIPFVLLIFGVAISRRTVLSRVMSCPPLILLGEASFAFYLIHTMMRKVYANEMTGPLLLMSYGMFLVIVIATSIGLHIVIEKPCRCFIRSVLAKRRFMDGGIAVRQPRKPLDATESSSPYADRAVGHSRDA